jgi:hypothetical protein
MALALPSNGNRRQPFFSYAAYFKKAFGVMVENVQSFCAENAYNFCGARRPNIWKQT